MRLFWIGPLLCALALAGCSPSQTVAPTAAPTVANAPVNAGEARPAPTTAPTTDTNAPAPTTATTSIGAAEEQPLPTPVRVALKDLTVGVETAVDGFTRPTHVTSAGDGSGRLFVVEQAGRIWVVRDGVKAETPFLDIEPLVGSNGNEQGLLSVAFHPRYAENGRFFVNYTDRAGDTVIAGYTVADGDPERADADSAAVLLSIDQPAPNHNGGLMKFGPDGMLYIGMGDGGAAGDPWGNAQNLATLLGKLLRISVDQGEAYAVPPDNPFVGQSDARPEIWAYGLRNPWRFSFDRATGDLYIGDVGQGEQEEISFQPATSGGGENYGWNSMEGTACYEAEECDQAGLAPPIAVYPHAGEEGGCSVTGGYVYRGAAFPQLTGVYFYADYCSGNLWGLRGRSDNWEHVLLTKLDIRATSFGEDETGELYIADRNEGVIYRLTAE